MGGRAAPRERRGHATPGGRTAGILSLWLVVLCAGCAVRQTIVLLPDPDGKVGRVEVSTGAGTQQLTRAGDMTTIRDGAAPTPATTADPGWIAATFAGAEAAEPAPPARFVLYFELGTTNLVPTSSAILPAIAESVRRRGAIEIAIAGHTDASGPDTFNDRLSLERAERVRALLLERGVPPRDISLSSHGKSSPAVPTRDGAYEPRNRRAEVRVQ